MDIERDEWAVMEAMLDRGEVSLIKQLLLFIHIKDSEGKGMPEDDLRRYSKVLTRLEANGFVKWRSVADPQQTIQPAGSGVKRSVVYQLNFINTKLL